MSELNAPSVPAIVKVAQPSSVGTIDHPRPDRLVRGNPRRETWSLYESGDGVSSVGIWACEPGMWRIVFAANKEEYFFVLEGHVRLHDEAGVAVDVRAGSPTYGKWAGARLTAAGGEQLLVPRGFAHGYVTLTDDCELFYKVDGLYAPQTEGSLIWNDPDVGIEWPWDGEVILSDKDKVAPRLKDMPVPAF